MEPEIIGPTQLYLGDCLNVMSNMEKNSIDLVVTSPPYWNQREYSSWPTYNDYMDSVEKWIEQISIILKPGRHCFWVIPDKLPWPPKLNGTRERLYMPIYADSERIATGHGLIPEFPIIWLKYQASQRMFGSYPYPPTIIHTPMTERICVWRKPGKADLSCKTEESKISLEDWKEISKDIWQFRAPDKKLHPAKFSLELPARCIKCWSFVNDVVFDPFMGEGTTGCACIKLKRQFVGSELNPEYFGFAEQEISKTVLEAAQVTMDGF